MLREKAVRTEAAELMDRLIESVMIYPDDANGPEAEIVAIVEDLVTFALNDNAAPRGGASSSTAVVAGAEFHRCRTRFLLSDHALVRDGRGIAPC